MPPSPGLVHVSWHSHSGEGGSSGDEGGAGSEAGKRGGGGSGGEGGGDGGDWGGTGQAVWQTYFNVVAQLLSFHVPPVDLSCMQSSPLP